MTVIPRSLPIYTAGILPLLLIQCVDGIADHFLPTMIVSLLNRGALSLAAVSLLASCAVAGVFEHLSAVPEGVFV